MLRQPFLEDCGNFGAQRRTSHFATFPYATDMSSDAELHVLSTERREFAVAETGLNGDKQKSFIAPSDPCARIGSGNEGGGLFCCQKLHRSARKTLRRDRQDALTLQGECRFIDRHELEKGM